jgi:hypothetical protein
MGTVGTAGYVKLRGGNMPTTKTGRKVKKSMMEKYGKEKGEEVYYASIVKGKPGSSKWEGKGGTGRLAKAKRTYKKKRG